MKMSRPQIPLTAVWPTYRPTGLIELRQVARRANVERVFAKLESERPLGNFKSLGGMLAGLSAISRAAPEIALSDLLARRADPAHLPRLICASDGNHGLAVAAAALRVGARATVFLPHGVSARRAARIEALGGQVVRVGGTYDDAVEEACAASQRGEGVLIPDTTQRLDDLVVNDVMAGYAIMTDELIAQFRQAKDWPTHLFVQAGVGGLAAAMAEGLSDGNVRPRLCVVEPERAACVARALAVGKPVRIEGDLETSAEMLSCGLASAPALEILLRRGAASVLVDEQRLSDAVEILRSDGPSSTPSGAAGVAGLLSVASAQSLRHEHGLQSDSRVLVVITEQAA